MYALKLELKLNNKERSLLAGCSGFKRVVYNFGLELVQESWSFDGIKASDAKRIDTVKKILTNEVMQKPEYSWMKNYPSTVYQSALQDLKDAFSRWRKGLAKIPVFKSKREGDSFTIYKTSGTYQELGKPALPFTNRQVLQQGKRISLPGLGEFRLKEKLKFTCSSQTFTISRQADKWFVSFTLDVERVPPLFHDVVSPIGIDLGVKCFATLSDGTIYVAPKPLKKAKLRLSKLQWRNRNKQLGNRKQGIRSSRNAQKFYLKQAVLHAEVSNQRRDYLQKTTTEISRKYTHVKIEDLNIKGMIANRKLSSAISDLGFYEFRRMLEYKQSFYSCQVELVDRWFPSSKTCSSCGCVKEKLSLSERIFNCSNCGKVIDRDLNAALNLAKYVPGATGKLMPMDELVPTPSVTSALRRSRK